MRPGAPRLGNRSPAEAVRSPASLLLGEVSAKRGRESWREVSGAERCGAGSCAEGFPGAWRSGPGGCARRQEARAGAAVPAGHGLSFVLRSVSGKV